jgi:hypothetical protein
LFQVYKVFIDGELVEYKQRIGRFEPMMMMMWWKLFPSSNYINYPLQLLPLGETYRESYSFISIVVDDYDDWCMTGVSIVGRWTQINEYVRVLWSKDTRDDFDYGQ